MHAHTVVSTVGPQLAQDASPAGSPQGGLMSTLPLIILMFGIIYFLILRPQGKEAKEHQALLAGLTKGTQVVTSSGLHGRVWEVRETEVVLEIADKVRVVVEKVSVKRRLAQETKEEKGSA